MLNKEYAYKAKDNKGVLYYYAVTFNNALEDKDLLNRMLCTTGEQLGMISGRV